MELFSIILLSLVFIETTALTVQQFSKGQRHSRSRDRKLFVDTSTLMDGRILSVAKAGFLSGEVYIPRSVIRELQLLADGSDAEKRSRARFGLDVANELTRVELANVEVFADEGDRVKVDERLLELAKEYNGQIMTNDFNLAKVAATEKIVCLNINELAQSLRSEYLPGDRLTVKIVGVGSNAHQGVAYLPDGTMVVVDDAERLANTGKPVEIEFVRYLQTSAGKMMFAKLAQKAKAPAKKPRNTGRNKKPTPKAKKN